MRRVERRFYFPDAFAEAMIELDPEQSLHASKVLRLGAGDVVSVFDGTGREAEFRIESVSNKKVSATFEREIEPDKPESPLAITLAVPILKKSNTETVLRQAVELGVSEFVPLLTARSEIPASRWNQERALRIAIEASKQCGRAVVPKISAPQSFEDFVKAAPMPGFLFYESDSDEGLPEKIEGSECTIVTGPEGGWKVEEIKSASNHGFGIVNFGGRTLRAETAAIAFTSIIQNLFGDIN
ncbi:MAG: RsmE family RNA methyltransferase [Pyrinomonadaceae bacterium]